MATMALAIACAPTKLSPEQYYGGTIAVEDTDGADGSDASGDVTVLSDSATDGANDGADATDATDGLDSTDGFDATVDVVDIDDVILPDGEAPDGEAPDGEAPDALDTDAQAPDTQEDTDTKICTPQCAGKACGEDGCGGLCGTCTEDELCSQVQKCIPKCIPQCFGKICGPDQCGGSCGTCGDDFECGADGKCYSTTCVPDCEGKACGDDGCSGKCGTCAQGDLCSVGQCVAGPCSGVPFKTGKCDEEGRALSCFGGSTLVVTDCNALDNKKCGWSAPVSAFSCIEKVDCFPFCIDGNECGEDGCGGVCGICPPGWPCNVGTCVPTPGGACGYYNIVGKCEGDVLWVCEGGTLLRTDCALAGKVCGFNPTVATNQCMDN